MPTANRHFTTVSSPNAETIAAALGGRKFGGGWVARCPAHEDQNPSLSIQEKHGKVLVHCFSGCHQDHVLEALRQRGLCPTESRASRPLAAAVVSQPSGHSLQALWDGYSPASPSHPYLTGKRIGTHGARAVPNQSTLAIPLTDTAGAIHSLQYIAADGGKKFLAGSKVTGHSFRIGDAHPSTTCYLARPDCIRPTGPGADGQAVTGKPRRQPAVGWPVTRWDTVRAVSAPQGRRLGGNWKSSGRGLFRSFPGLKGSDDGPRERGSWLPSRHRISGHRAHWQGFPR